MGSTSSDAAGRAGDADCDKPVCAVKGDMVDLMKQVARNKQKAPHDEVGTSSVSVSVSASSSSQSTHPPPCPVDREELGQGTWALVRSPSDIIPTCIYTDTHPRENHPTLVGELVSLPLARGGWMEVFSFFFVLFCFVLLS